MRPTIRFALGLAIGGALLAPLGPISRALAHELPVRVERDPGPAAHAWASWYGPGFYGSGVACTGKPLGLFEMNAAAIDSIPCGTRVTFYYRGRRALATITDRGAFAKLGRTFDLGPGVRRALGMYGVIHVGYRFGWPSTVTIRRAHCHAVRRVGRPGAVRRCARSWPATLNHRIVWR